MPNWSTTGLAKSVPPGGISFPSVRSCDVSETTTVDAGGVASETWTSTLAPFSSVTRLVTLNWMPG